MKRYTIKSIIKFWIIVKLGFKAVFTKKVFTHLDNADPILNLLKEGDFKLMSVSQRIALKEEVDRRFRQDLLKMMHSFDDDIEHIKRFLNN